MAEAAAILTERSDAKLLAGGQSLMPMINLGLAQVEALVDISAVPGLDGVTAGDGSLEIGALTRHRTLETDQTVRDRQPLLAEAVRHVGNPRVRNLGTLGGSLAHNDPAAELPMVMQALDAVCTISDGKQTRQVEADEFFVSYFTTALGEEDILVSVQVPSLPSGWGWGFQEYAVRAGDFALGMAGAIARCRGGVIEDVRLGLGGVGERAVRAHAFEQAAKGTPVDQLDRIAAAIDEDIQPLEDPFASEAYRRHLAKVLATRAVRDACERSQEGKS